MLWSITAHERLRSAATVHACSAALFGIGLDDLRHMFAETDLPIGFGLGANSKGFWRVDKQKHPEHRHTILSLVAFHDLQEQIAACGGDVTAGIEAFCNQNDGEGWMLPETLRLADYGLGHDDRAREHQPVRECFGPRFYDWQLAQSAEESWRECHLHARNLLGADGYQALLDGLEGKEVTGGNVVVGGRGSVDGKQNTTPATGHRSPTTKPSPQKKLFETEHFPLFDKPQGE